MLTNLLRRIEFHHALPAGTFLELARQVNICRSHECSSSRMRLLMDKSKCFEGLRVFVSEYRFHLWQTGFFCTVDIVLVETDTFTIEYICK